MDGRRRRPRRLFKPRAHRQRDVRSGRQSDATPKHQDEGEKVEVVLQHAVPRAAATSTAATVQPATSIQPATSVQLGGPVISLRRKNATE